MLRDKKDASHEGRLIRLQPSQTTDTHRGSLQHDDMIGKEPRQIVTSSRRSPFRLHEPTLADYVRLTRRLVTPIYASDANLIVSLLDLHVDTPSGGPNAEPPLEILEAGTGHGALTLHLSRAIHAANPPLPKAPSCTSNQEEGPEDAVYLGESMADFHESVRDSWKASRRAIVHTIDISDTYSKHAQKIVEGFRHGMYAGNVDFHVGDVSEWIAAQTRARKSQASFLSHVFLDLPKADSHFANIAPALHVNGLLAVFNPSITQIAECVEIVRKQKMPYLLDQVIELGAGTIREWDVRAVRPRAPRRKVATRVPDIASIEEYLDPDLVKEVRGGERAEDGAAKEEELAMVCRPKVGQLVIGGGFLGLWRKMEPGKEYLQPEQKTVST